MATFSQARENMREWSRDLEALRAQVEVSIGKDGQDAAAIMAAWKIAQEGFAAACREYAETAMSAAT